MVEPSTPTCSLQVRDVPVAPDLGMAAAGEQGDRNLVDDGHQFLLVLGHAAVDLVAVLQDMSAVEHDAVVIEDVVDVLEGQERVQDVVIHAQEQDDVVFPVLLRVQVRHIVLNVAHL